MNNEHEGRCVCASVCTEFLIKGEKTVFPVKIIFVFAGDNTDNELLNDS